MSGAKTQSNCLVDLRTDIDPHGDCGFLSLNNTPRGLLHNMFHIVFGAIGLFIVSTGEAGFSFFNIGFGLIDLYQAVASFFGLWPYSISTGLQDDLRTSLWEAICPDRLGLLNSKSRVRLHLCTRVRGAERQFSNLYLLKPSAPPQLDT
jgi:hypothetical protein